MYLFSYILSTHFHPHHMQLGCKSHEGIILPVLPNTVSPVPDSVRVLDLGFKQYCEMYTWNTFKLNNYVQTRILVK